MNFRPFFLCCPLLMGFFAAAAEPVESSTQQAPQEVSSESSPKEIALDRLLSERNSQQALQEAIGEALKVGVSQQTILEARFLYHIDRREDDAVAEMAPEIVKQRELFKIEDSSICGHVDDWLAITEYVQAMASLKQGDKAGFKSHITEAFWLSPHQAAAFAPHVERLRLADAMLAVKIDFDMKLASSSGNEELTFTGLANRKKAMVLHFWSPTNMESTSSLPDYAATAKFLEEKGIAMVSLLTGDTGKNQDEARKVLLPLGANPPGFWLVDPIDHSLAKDLRVQSLPIVVLVSTEGKILFNGEPGDDAFWTALMKIDPSLSRPELASPSE
jgi:hypothetical protein